jgi:hypothetical protein
MSPARKDESNDRSHLARITILLSHEITNGLEADPKLGFILLLHLIEALDKPLTYLVKTYVRPSSEVTDDPSKLARYLSQGWG